MIYFILDVISILGVSLFQTVVFVQYMCVCYSHAVILDILHVCWV